MASIEESDVDSVSDVGFSAFTFHDNQGFFETAQKSAQLGHHFFGWMNERLREILSAPFVSLGETLRDLQYFPLTYPNDDQKWNMEMGAHFHELLTGNETIPKTNAFSFLDEVRKHFKIETIPITVQSGEHTYTFQVRIVESKEKVDGKGLRLFLFSFYGNQVGSSKWSPKSIDELGMAPIVVLKALKEQGFEMDSLDLFSLGSVAFQGLQHLEAEDADLIPKMIILDRGMSSTYKVGMQLFFPQALGALKFMAIYGSAYVSNWDADPETSCLNFFDRVGVGEGRTFIQIQATKDSYFSDDGAFDPSFIQRLQEMGMNTYSGTFYAPGYASRADHALSRSLLYNSPESGTSAEDFIEMQPLETLADALVGQVHLNGAHSSGSHHNSFVVGGNSEDLNLVLMRNYPMLQAFVSKL